MPKIAMSDADKRVLWHHMRTPAYCFAALLVLLGVNVLTGALLPYTQVAWKIEAGATALMVLTVLLFSMEVLREPPLLRVFASIGFFWVGILFALTLVDYLTR